MLEKKKPKSNGILMQSIFQRSTAKMKIQRLKSLKKLAENNTAGNESSFYMSKLRNKIREAQSTKQRVEKKVNKVTKNLMVDVFSRTDSPMTAKKFNQVSGNNTRYSFSPMNNFWRKETQFEDVSRMQKTQTRNRAGLSSGNRKTKSGFNQTTHMKRSSSMINNPGGFNSPPMRDFGKTPDTSANQKNLNLIKEESKKSSLSNMVRPKLSWKCRKVIVSAFTQSLSPFQTLMTIDLPIIYKVSWRTSFRLWD